MNRKDRRAARKQSKTAPLRRQGLAPGALAGNLFADAVQHYRAGRLDDSERLCRDVLMFDRNHFEALHLLGMLAAHAGNLEGAVDILAQSLAVNDANAECHFHRGDMLRTLGRSIEATEHLAQAIAIKPDFAAAYVAMGDVLTVNVNLDDAREYYARALGIEPERIDALYGLANVSLLQGRPDEAADLYRRVLAKTPFADAHCKLGMALAEQEDWQGAMEQYRQALALKPDFPDAHRVFGYALLRRGDIEQALAAARQALALSETPEIKALFVQCALALPTLPADDADLRALASRAVAERWGDPEAVSALSARLA